MEQANLVKKIINVLYLSGDEMSVSKIAEILSVKKEEIMNILSDLKSTLTNALVKLMVQKGLKVGVIAVDPTSPFTGGALLGARAIEERAERLNFPFKFNLAPAKGCAPGECSEIG